MKKAIKSKSRYVRMQVYFKTDDQMQMEIYKQLREMSKDMGVSMSAVVGMSLRRGVPLAKGDWDALMQSHQK
jgi:hypothetical protein